MITNIYQLVLCIYIYGSQSYKYSYKYTMVSSYVFGFSWQQQLSKMVITSHDITLCLGNSTRKLRFCTLNNVLLWEVRGGPYFIAKMCKIAWWTLKRLLWKNNDYFSSKVSCMVCHALVFNKPIPNYYCKVALGNLTPQIIIWITSFIFW